MPSTVASTLERRDPTKLKNHPLNAKIYGDVADDEFVKSCKGGIQTPLIITPDGVVISGHRRRQAAIKNGTKEVPVIVRHDLKSETDVQLALLDCNLTREKTKEQRAREYAVRAELEAKKAKERQKEHGKTAPGRKAENTSVNLKEVNAKESKRVAAESVGFSRNTAEKAIEVVKEIDKAEAAGKPEKAAELRETLETKSVSAAHRKVSEPKSEKKPHKPFNDTTIDSEIGKLVRLFDDRASATKTRDSAGHNACIEACEAVNKAWKKWRSA